MWLGFISDAYVQVAVCLVKTPSMPLNDVHFHKPGRIPLPPQVVDHGYTDNREHVQEPLSCFARCSALPGVWEEQECSGEGQQLEAVRGWGLPSHAVIFHFSVKL